MDSVGCMYVYVCIYVCIYVCTYYCGLRKHRLMIQRSSSNDSSHTITVSLTFAFLYAPLPSASLYPNHWRTLYTNFTCSHVRNVYSFNMAIVVGGGGGGCFMVMVYFDGGCCGFGDFVVVMVVVVAMVMVIL